MARKIYKLEEIVNLLRQVEVAVANGKMTPQACKEAGIVEQTYYRWRKEYGGLKVDQTRRLKELEQENSKTTTSTRKCSGPISGYLDSPQQGQFGRMVSSLIRRVL